VPGKSCVLLLSKEGKRSWDKKGEETCLLFPRRSSLLCRKKGKWVLQKRQRERTGSSPCGKRPAEKPVAAKKKFRLSLGKGRASKLLRERRNGV